MAYAKRRSSAPARRRAPARKRAASPARRRAPTRRASGGKRQSAGTHTIRIVMEMPSASGTAAFPAPGQMKAAPAPRKARF